MFPIKMGIGAFRSMLFTKKLEPPKTETRSTPRPTFPRYRSTDTRNILKVKKAITKCKKHKATVHILPKKKKSARLFLPISFYIIDFSFLN